MRKRTRLLLLGASQASTLGIATPVAAAAANDPKPRQDLKTRRDAEGKEGKHVHGDGSK